MEVKLYKQQPTIYCPVYYLVMTEGLFRTTCQIAPDLKTKTPEVDVVNSFFVADLDKVEITIKELVEHDARYARSIIKAFEYFAYNI